MNIIYGYCRISTPNQNIERQERNIITSYPNAIIVKEIYTGTKVQGRTEFEKILDNIKIGDTIVFDSVSRMSRNAEEGSILYEELFNRDINLVFLKEPHINTSVFKEALNHQIEINVDTGYIATDTFINTILDALKKFQIDITKKQMALAFDRSEKEVSDLRQRTKEGLETAKLNGKRVGMEKGRKIRTKKEVESKKKIVKFSKCFEGINNDKEVIAILGINRKTYYKYKNELLNEFDIH